MSRTRHAHKSKADKARDTVAKERQRAADLAKADSRDVAATAVARAWLAKEGFREDTSDTGPSASDVDFTGSEDFDGGMWVGLRMFVSNLDIECAEAGEHLDVNQHLRDQENAS